VELGEKYSRSFRRWSYRVLRMVMLPGDEYLMGLVEIEVVEKAKALIQRCGSCGHIGRQRRNYEHTQA
jgi:hypothetical protein